MEEERKLYPFVLIPVSETPDEVFHLADLGFPDSMIRNGWLSTNTLSEIMETYMDRVVGDGVFASFGRQFPVMIKTIKLHGRTPLTVHPDDEIAAQRFDFLGKAKIWHFSKVSDDTVFYFGFRRDVESGEFYDACKGGDVEALLNAVKPRQGESWYIPPGVVHAASGKAEIVEIAESSPLDFRVFNWGESEEGLDPFDAELTLEAAFDFINYGEFVPVPLEASPVQGMRRIYSGPEFNVSVIPLEDPLRIDNTGNESFSAYLCLKGEAAVRTDGGEEGAVVKAGEAVLVPAETEVFYLVPLAEGTSLVEVLVEREPVQAEAPAVDEPLYN